MSLSISPSVAFMPSIFYDRNHNPLNIPCEGPKIVPMFLDPDTSDDGVFIINFNQLFTSGQLTALQSMTFDPIGLKYLVGGVPIEFAGTGQTISIGVNDYQAAGTQTFPIACLTPPTIAVDLSLFKDSGEAVRLGLQFYNYQHPVFLSYPHPGS